jgi:cytochrome c peroxidase
MASIKLWRTLMVNLKMIWIAASCSLLLIATGCGGGAGGGAAASAGGAPTETIAAANGVLAIAPVDSGLSRRELLGKLLFNDRNLSEPRGTACASCHQTNLGFSGLNGAPRLTGTPQGSVRGVFGLRTAMSNAYQSLIPAFEFVTTNGETEASGGHFWDGRALTLEEQALGPFLNTAEMNNASGAAVVAKVQNSPLARTFRDEFGATAFADPTTAFNNIGVAIAAFNRSAQLSPFTSKYDAMIQGKATFTPAESRGMALFKDPLRANCAGCHIMNSASANPKDSPFSEFTYYATGVPRNAALSQNNDPNFYDLGLCGPNRSKPVLPASVPVGVTAEDFCGKFRMVSLRNVTERPTWMHNGFFKNLREVVRFYSTRNTDPTRWYGASGVMNDLPPAYLGNIEKVKAPFNRAANAGPLLSEPEIDDVLAFLRTLNDGFVR